MPKELARVVSQYTELNDRWRRLEGLLTDRLNNYIVLRDIYSECLKELANACKEAGVRTPSDPSLKARPKEEAAVKSMLKQADKYGSLLAARREEWDDMSLKVAEVRDDAIALHKNVLAVIKAKSGFFSTSKSLPALKKYATDLQTFAKTLQDATTLSLRS